ncbi:MAG: heterocyst frequency control protein PatD [Oscillatoriaceae bacterium SKW80]|nr:heterocyst frequency control protein PatD [Oscillatoriaceae bacterium SKYG93]MCX8119426.1 heterocyst frequency control protein PatD [Oscillatoriaceae bacterium SKW80]MDW8454893.1 heterocyst frequency control protein PatD [Oscillatoriaceae cyanobacterium SKYGB_i_bin93]HIK28328.1 heterocyst frequency control protein PatD [Oscillatoriaceae cyanobacterium M7585_C2015_266]
MVPSNYRKKYTEFKQTLEQLQEITVESDTGTLWKSFSGVQEFFGREILGLKADDISPEMASRIQSLHTEMHKQLRLLKMDLMFLRSAHSSETLRVRQIQVSDRLKTLLGYCSALLGE